MENSKLGVVINTTKANNRTSGFRAIYSYNSDGWSSVVRDTGAELKKVTNNTASAPIHFIQFESNGCCCCIMQAIAGRKDYQSAWIFIHKDIILPKGEIISIIQKVEEVLSLDVEDKKAELDSLFEKSYATTNSPSYSVSSGDTYAVRYYGTGTDFMYTRSSVFDDFLYQSEYCKYKSVFLVDKESGQTVSDVQDLSNVKLEKSYVIEVPSELYGFKHNLESDSLRVTEGSSVQVRWTRSGYAPVDKKGKCSEDLLIQKSDCRRSFRLNLFRVIDKVTGDTLNIRPKFEVKCRVDDKTNPTTVYFREDELDNISCRVDLQSYESFNDILDLTKPNEKGEYVIELQPKQHVYNCSFETNIPDVHTIEFRIVTRYILNGSEIPGFRFEGTPSETKVNRLRAYHKQTVIPSDERKVLPVGIENSKKQKDRVGVGKVRGKKNNHSLLYVLIVVGLLVIIGGCGYFLYQNVFQSNRLQDVSVNYEDVAESQENEWEETLNYLREHSTEWVQSEMESYPDLKGVYAMIRDFQFKKLKSFIDEHPDLKEIDAWVRLYEKVKDFNDKKGRWSDDGSINIEKYLGTDFSLKPDVEQPDKSNDNLKEAAPTGNKDLKENKDGTHRNNGKKNGSGAGTSNNNSQDALN